MILEILSLFILQMNPIGRFSVRKAGFGEKAKDVAGQPFVSASEGSEGQDIQSHRRLFEEVRGVTHGSLATQQRPEVEMGLQPLYLFHP